MVKRFIKRLIRLCYNIFVRPKIYSTNVPIRMKIGKKTKIELGSIIDRNTIIGKYCYIGHNCLITKSKIGNYCSLGPGVKIGLGEHDLRSISTNSQFYENSYDLLTSDDVEIGPDVWIGADAIILRGVKIGVGAVIGANSVITKDVPDFAVYVGVPGKLVKYRFESQSRDVLLKSKWWEKDILEARQIQKQLSAKINDQKEN